MQLTILQYYYQLSEARQSFGQLSFGQKRMVLLQKTFLVFSGNNIVSYNFANVAYNFAQFAANDIKADKLPLETDPAACDYNTSTS